MVTLKKQGKNMQKTLLNLLTILALSFTIIGCGGGGGGSAPADKGGGGTTPIPTTPTTTTVTLSGTAIDGLIKSATVCIDTNENNLCDSGEPTTTTDTNGNYSFDVAQNSGTKNIIVLGGIDTATNSAFTGILKEKIAIESSPITSINITPLTTTATLLADEQNITIASAKQTIATKLGLSSADISKNPLTDVAVYKKTQEIVQATKVLQSQIQKDDTNQTTNQKAFDHIIKQIALTLKDSTTNGTLNINALTTKLEATTYNNQAVVIPSEVKTFTAGYIAEVNTKLASVNTTTNLNDIQNGLEIHTNTAKTNIKNNQTSTLSSTLSSFVSEDTFAIGGNGSNGFFGEDGTPTPIASTTVTGQALASYISGGTAFVDCNKNGIKDSGELSTTTDVTGNFSITGLICDDYNIVITGGTNAATGLAMLYPTIAPKGYDKVSPLTTMLTGLTATEQTTLLANLGIVATDLNRDYNVGSTDATVQAKVAKLVAIKFYVEIVARTSTSKDDLAKVASSFKDAIATAKGSSTSVDFTSSTVLANLNTALIANLNMAGITTTTLATLLTNLAPTINAIANTTTATELTTAIKVAEVSNSDVIAIVTPTNQKPVATFTSFTTDEDTTYNGTLAATDADGNTLTYSKVSNALFGTVIVNSNGNFTYIPSTNYSGADSFSYKVNDGTIDSLTKTVNIVINSVEDVTDDHPNTTTNVTTINLNSEVTGNLELSDDVDYFKFVLTETKTVEFERESVNGTVGQAKYAYFDVYNNAGSRILDDSVNQYSVTKQSLTLTAGTYYIKIATFGNDVTGYRLILNSSTDNFRTLFFDDFNDYNTTLWQKANWANGNPFYNGWCPDQLLFADGNLTLTLEQKACNTKTHASGEYQSLATYQYGRYTARFKASDVNGTISSLFVYTGPSATPSTEWDEIDIEILGKDPTKVQFNYWRNGHEHPVLMDLGFDASAAMHTYSFVWHKDYIEWYVDGQLIHRVIENNKSDNDSLPINAAKIMLNLWAGTGIDSWSGAYEDNTTVQTVYDYVSFEEFIEQ